MPGPPTEIVPGRSRLGQASQADRADWNAVTTSLRRLQTQVDALSKTVTQQAATIAANAAMLANPQWSIFETGSATTVPMDAKDGAIYLALCNSNDVTFQLPLLSDCHRGDAGSVFFVGMDEQTGTYEVNVIVSGTDPMRDIGVIVASLNITQIGAAFWIFAGATEWKTYPAGAM